MNSVLCGIIKCIIRHFIIKASPPHILLLPIVPLSGPTLYVGGFWAFPLACLELGPSLPCTGVSFFAPCSDIFGNSDRFGAFVGPSPVVCCCDGSLAPATPSACPTLTMVMLEGSIVSRFVF